MKRAGAIFSLLLFSLLTFCAGVTLSVDGSDQQSSVVLGFTEEERHSHQEDDLSSPVVELIHSDFNHPRYHSLDQKLHYRLFNSIGMLTGEPGQVLLPPEV